MNEKTNMLRGADAIAVYCGISIPTLMERIFTWGFPAFKAEGEVTWQADKRKVDEWLDDQHKKFSAKIEEDEAPPKKQGRPKRRPRTEGF